MVPRSGVHIPAKAHAPLTRSGRDAPACLDLLHFSVVAGMTQVSDVQTGDRRLHRLALLHGLPSFLFNTLIAALTVNIAAGPQRAI